MKKIEKTIELGGRKLTLSTGHVAEQADSAVIASYGETVVLATVVSSEPREDWGYFPLTVEYREPLYAGGRIKGSRWVKREGRPADEETLTARLIDRSIRPLFPKGYKKEVQVIVKVLSVDLENSPDIVAALAVSAALHISPIPWNGPVATVKVGMKDDAYFINPLDPELDFSEMELVVSTTKEAVVMIEAASRQVPEEKILGGIEFGQAQAQAVLDFIEKFAQEIGVKKEAYQEEKATADLKKKIKELAGEKIAKLISGIATKKAHYSDYDLIRQVVIDSVDEEQKNQAGKVFDELFASQIRQMILSGKRPDGRKLDEIRELSAEVGVLPRTHGSAMFKRGQTQALSVATLGGLSLEQAIESAEGEETKRFIHYYSMPPYSVGETGRVGWPSRREIGHGALAEKALLPVIPTEEEFPYTIMVVSEILSSNGSTSMASVCGATLALMDAGVPIKKPVAGIAMGLVIEDEKNYAVLTDIVGIEDGSGDMDFKVAGTEDGVTALQLDVKSLRLTLPILEKALTQAKKARGKILEVMLRTLPEHRAQVSVYAPKVKVIKIDQEKIGDLIGPGGRTIRKLISDTGAQIDVEDDGSVNISAQTEAQLKEAEEKIKALTQDVEPGKIYEGVVKRTQPFGVFVEILPGKEGLVHISDMSKDFVKEPTDLVNVGDKVKVRVKEIDNFGRVNLSMVLDQDDQKNQRDEVSKPRRGRSDRRKRPAGMRRKSAGPHFPASRFLDDRKKRFSR